MIRVEKSAGLLISEIVSRILENILLYSVRANEEVTETLSIGTFQNGREEGYTYTVSRWEETTKNALSEEAQKKLEEIHSTFTWCTYEHRNSDNIIVNGRGGRLMPDELPYIGESKYDYLGSFRYDEYGKAAQLLADQILDFLQYGKIPKAEGEEENKKICAGCGEEIDELQAQVGDRHAACS
jgi:hypothetical protein